MGNGFTFELESLLFYVLSRAVAYFSGVSGIISVYGDDIIVPTDIAVDLEFVLGVLGFSVNPEKSFSTGTFRESCGGHYDGGCDVTPFYVKADIISLTDLILLLNKITKWELVHSHRGCIVSEFHGFYSWAKELVPRRLWGGVDVNANHSLVTGDLPRGILQGNTVRRKLGVGAYVLTLRSPVTTEISSGYLMSLAGHSVKPNKATVDLDVLSIQWMSSDVGNLPV